MIKKNALIAQFERMYREHWAYDHGAAREGCVDCSGALVYAYKRLGGPAIAHGSNSIFRQSIGAHGSAALPGYAAFKVRPWTDADKVNRWYGTEPGNVYHVGLVDDSGKYVLNAKSEATGFSRDPIAGWTCFAPLKAVEYGEDETTMRTTLYQAQAHTRESKTVNLRATPGGTVIGAIPRGGAVDVLNDSGGWWRVRYDGREGYASGAYLTRVEDADVVQSVPGAAEEDRAFTTLIGGDGMMITLAGRWRVASD